ncbi:YagK/YfjJ domain-containing protein [Pseudodesulfovibrio sp.]|uniref:YagK/YfjJ domain-containing protein n=1 Tax=unclassified Pseudodesulfovibrio TaxID=2661612 RepID=UPI003AFFADC3
MYKSNYNTHDVKILTAIENLIDKSVKLRNKNLYVRIDIRYPENIQYPNDNCALSVFLDSFKHYCDRKKLGLIYFWIREASLNSDTATHHYHAIFLLDGRYIQNPYKILEKATYLWGKRLGCDATGLVHYCRHKNNTHPNPYAIQIRRTSPDAAEVIYEVKQNAQYLAKRHSKENYLCRTKQFACSLI